jgi:hypothetical protein
MWEPRRLTTLWAFTVCYGIDLPFILPADAIIGLLDIIHRCFYLKQIFGAWPLPQSSFKKPNQLGPHR